MSSCDVEIFVSYVEIYNEQIRDLLIPKENSAYLELRDDPIKGVTLAGANEITVESVEEVMNLLIQGNRQRTTEATNANQTSSRSHAVFQINLSITPKTKNIATEKIVSKLSLIDLAGSERGTVTENRGIRLREGAKINQSLLALANCINALGDKSKKGSFVPYRDSKLTRMLKDSLGGNCKTVMVVTISPASSQFEETLNTLKYANRAKNITTKPTENKKLVEFHIAEYKNIISDLRNEIDSLRLRLKVPNSSENNEMCDYCKGEREKEEETVDVIKRQLFDNFQERIQISRGLCELEAQNQLNAMEIKEGQHKLMRYTLSTSGKLIEKENHLDDEFKNLPPNLRKEMNDIKKLQVSVDLNEHRKAKMISELENRTREARKLMEMAFNNIRHQDKRDYLEMVVKNYMLQIENDELEYNLRLQEKLNIILVEEIKRLRSICDTNGIILSEDNDDDFDDERGFTASPKVKSPTPKNLFRKQIASNESYNEIANIETRAISDKKKDTKYEMFPPIEEFNTPKDKSDNRFRSKKQSQDRKADLAKMDKEIKNAVNVVNSLQILGQEVFKDKKKRVEDLKRNSKVGKNIKISSKNSLYKEPKNK